MISTASCLKGVDNFRDTVVSLLAGHRAPLVFEYGQARF